MITAEQAGKSLAPAQKKDPTVSSAKTDAAALWDFFVFWQMGVEIEI